MQRDRESTSFSIALGTVRVLYMYEMPVVNRRTATQERPNSRSIKSGAGSGVCDASDALVRAALKSTWLGNHDGSAILDEVGLFRGQSRVDLIVVGDRLEAYEIKSNADSLSRLPAQALTYSRVFERVTLVCATRHVARASALVPEWWGILEAANGLPLIQRRDARDNPEIDAHAVAQLLWRDDALDVLARRERATGLWTSTRAVIWRAVSDYVPPAELLAEAREFLKRRAAIPTALPSA